MHDGLDKLPGHNIKWPGLPFVRILRKAVENLSLFCQCKGTTSRNVIPAVEIEGWEPNAPWVSPNMVEHDYLLVKALYAIFTSDFLYERLAVDGGTALHKLHIAGTPRRYTELLQVTQVHTEPIRETCDLLRSSLSWLDKKPRYDVDRNSFTFHFRYFPTHLPTVRRALRIVIDTREHKALRGYTSMIPHLSHPEYVKPPRIVTYHSEELAARLFRKIFTRGKGRDAFDFWCAQRVLHLSSDCSELFSIIRQMFPEPDVDGLVTFVHKMRSDARFRGDTDGLLRYSSTYDIDESLDLLEDVVNSCFG